MPRRCIAFNPDRERFQLWTRCPARAYSGDIYCRRHRDALIGAVIGLHNAYTNKIPPGFPWYYPLPGEQRDFDFGELWRVLQQLRRRAAPEAESRGGEAAGEHCIPCGRQAGQGFDSGDIAHAAQHEAARPSVAE